MNHYTIHVTFEYDDEDSCGAPMPNTAYKKMVGAAWDEQDAIDRATQKLVSLYGAIPESIYILDIIEKPQELIMRELGEPTLL